MHSTYLSLLWVLLALMLIAVLAAGIFYSLALLAVNSSQVSVTFVKQEWLMEMVALGEFCIRTAKGAFCAFVPMLTLVVLTGGGINAR
jgi:hypothetical protein